MEISRLRRSIVFRAAFFTAIGSALLSIVVFALLFQMQRAIYEQRLLNDAEDGITRISQTFLGYFYAQQNWVYLEDQQRAFNRTKNVLYSYMVNAEGVIDLGLDGLQSPDVGKLHQSWEPAIPLSTEWAPERRAFVANEQLAHTFGDRVHAGDRLVLISSPISCLTVRSICGYLRVAIVFETIGETLGQLRTTFTLAAILLTLGTASIAFFALRKNLIPVRAISERMRNVAQRSTQTFGDIPSSVDMTPVTGNEAEETRFFRESLDQFTTAFQRASALETELKLSRSLSDLAAQVAHDIRSPLAALEIVSSNLSEIPEDRRIMLRSALSRIRDIANNLLSNNVPQIRSTRVNLGKEFNETQETDSSIYLLSSLVDGLLSEKRIQHRSRIGLEIEGILPASTYGVFVRVPSDGFKRVLSNVINNAVEAIEGQGSVTIRVEPVGDFARIDVVDSGKGIPTENIPRLMTKGFSHGKDGGLGLGLFHAKGALETWGGRIEIASTVGVGTTVSLWLPRVEPPVWFVPEIRLSSGLTVVVLDDDTSIHQVWERRFEIVEPQTFHVIHFSTPEEFLTWFKFQRRKHGEVLYLMDYEFVESERTGIQLCTELGIEASTVLVTSRFEEPKLLSGCTERKLKLLPKGQAGFVPIVFAHDRRQPDAVLIDDDILIRDAWAASFRRQGKTLETYGSLNEFKAIWSELSPLTTIYIDSHLGDGIKGEIFAKDLFERGFRELYLATGYPASVFPAMPWLKAIVSKDPP